MVAATSSRRPQWMLGRASQENSSIWFRGLASARWAPGHHKYQRAGILITGQALIRHWVPGLLDLDRSMETYHQPSIQLLKFTEGPAAGTREIRFCYYDHNGRFQRSPLIIDERDIPNLRRALKSAPRLAQMLANLVGARLM